MPDTFVAIEIGGTKLQVAYGMGDGRVSERRRLAVDPAQGAGAIREQVAAVIPGLCGRGEPRAVGVGFGGPVDWRTGRAWRPYQVNGWGGFDLRGWLEELLGLPTFVDNDANVAALAESTVGAGAGASSVCYVTLSSGVGAGLVVDGEVFRADPPGELELGHVRLDRGGTTVQDRCAGWALDARVGAAASSEPSGVLAALLASGASPPAAVLGPALARGDSAAARSLDGYAADLAFGLSHVVHLVHPQVIVLGGGVSLIGEPLRSAVEGHLRGFIMDSFLPGPRVTLAGLREDAVPVGALLLAARGLRSPLLQRRIAR